MRATRLARRIGLDHNPLRRRTDMIGTCCAALLVTLFLAGAPLLSVAAVGWAARAVAADQHAERSWHRVPAVLLRDASLPVSFGGFADYSWAPARWTAPDGQARTGDIPVGTTMAAGQVVTLWVDTGGWPTGPPLSHHAALGRESAAAAVATVALGILLLGLAAAGRWMLDRRRLKEWGTAWSTVEPRWTKGFRSRG